MNWEKKAREVLRHFPLPGMTIHPVPRGGFSGAFIWQVQSAGSSFCLKAWPRDCQTAGQLHLIHQWLGHLEALPFVPRVIQGRHYQSVFFQEGRLWDLTTWMPGNADFWSQPKGEKMAAAATALAQIHSLWPPDSVPQTAPAIQRRILRFNQWVKLLSSGWKPDFSQIPILQNLAPKAWDVLVPWIQSLPNLLHPWETVPVPVQPCLCDLWHDHVLFTGNDVTGIIDFGSCKKDCVAVDLARLLGSLAEDNPELRPAGFKAYEKIRPLGREEKELVDVLDRSGTILALVNWLTWIYHDQKTYENWEEVRDRLSRLIQRVEHWPRKIFSNRDPGESGA